MSDIFISYSHQDQAFVRRLYDALTERKQNAFVDWEGIPASAEWMREIHDAIVKSDAILFILSPDFAASQTCRTELALAEQNKKRLIPIVYRDVAPQDIPETLAKLNWIFMREGDDFDSALAAVETAIETDPDYVHAATSLLVRARQWEDKNENTSLLLRGSELKGAESWLASSGGREPAPSQMHTRYIVASRQASSRRQRGIIGVLSIVIALMVVLTSTTLVFYRQANENAATANIRALAAQSLTTTFGINLDERLLLSLLAVHESGNDLRYEAHNSLLTLIQSNPEILGYLHTPNAQVGDGPIRLVESDDGRILVSYSNAGLYFWDMQQRPIMPREISLPKHENDENGALLAISADGSRVALAGIANADGSDGETLIVNPSTGQIVATYHQFSPTVIALSADGKQVAASIPSSPSADQQRIAVWDINGSPLHPSKHIDVEPPATLRSFGISVTRLAFNSTDMLLAVSTDLGGTSLWNLNTGQTRHVSDLAPTISESGLPGLYSGLAFSSDDTWLVVSAGNATEIFKMAKDQATLTAQLPIGGEITVPKEGAFYLAHCADILTCSTIHIVPIELDRGTMLPEDTISGVGLLAHIAGNGPVALSTNNGSILLLRPFFHSVSVSPHLLGNVDPESESYFSPNGHFIAAFHKDGTLALWNTQTLMKLTDISQTNGIVHDEETSNPVGVSNDGREVVAMTISGEIQVHRNSSVVTLVNAPRILTEDLSLVPGKVALVQLAMDWSGQRVAAITCIGPQASCATTEVDVWDAFSGKRIASRIFTYGASIAFTPDGNTLAIGQLNAVSFYEPSHNTVTTPLHISNVGIIEALGFDASGKTLAALSDISAHEGFIGSGNNLLLWDVQTGNQLGLPQPYLSSNVGLSFDAQDNLYVLDTTSIDRYNYSLRALSIAACIIANRNLTRAEWQQFADDEPYVKLCADLP